MDEDTPDETKGQGDDHLTTDEVESALAALSDDDFVRLERLARNRVFGLPDVEPMELINTAVERALVGTRKWPRGLPALVFLAGAMRSIATEHWHRVYREREDIAPSPSSAGHGDGNPGGLPDGIPSEFPDPEREMLAKQMLEQVEQVFADDDEALTLVMARAEGYSPVEIQRDFDMDAQQYVNASKRVQRKLATYKKKEQES